MAEVEKEPGRNQNRQFNTAGKVFAEKSSSGYSGA